jgi:hypothetical protein
MLSRRQRGEQSGNFRRRQNRKRNQLKPILNLYNDENDEKNNFRRRSDAGRDSHTHNDRMRQE